MSIDHSIKFSYPDVFKGKVWLTVMLEKKITDFLKPSIISPDIATYTVQLRPQAWTSANLHPNTKVTFVTTVLGLWWNTRNVLGFGATLRGGPRPKPPAYKYSWAWLQVKNCFPEVLCPQLGGYSGRGRCSSLAWWKWTCCNFNNQPRAERG